MHMTTTQSTQQVLTAADEIEAGNVLQIVGTEITGSVLQTHLDRIEINWSDGHQSVERYPIVGICFL